MTGRSRHDELRALAVAATQGPWSVANSAAGRGQVWAHRPGYHGRYCIMYDAFGYASEGDAAYIAAVSPDVLLALLGELAAAEARAAELERERDEARSAAFDDDWQFRHVCRERDAERARTDKAERELAEYTTDIGYKAGYEAAKRVYAARADKATQALARAAHLVSHLVQQVPEFTGVIGPGGEREDDYIRDQILAEADEWRALGGVSSGTQEHTA